MGPVKKKEKHTSPWNPATWFGRRKGTECALLAMYKFPGEKTSGAPKVMVCLSNDILFVNHVPMYLCTLGSSDFCFFVFSL